MVQRHAVRNKRGSVGPRGHHKGIHRPLPKADVSGVVGMVQGLKPSPWDEPLFGQYLRALKAMGRPLPRLRKFPRKEGVA
jgi:hypothetical protein